MAMFFGPAWAVAGSFLAMKFAISASNSSLQAACQDFAVKEQGAKVGAIPGEEPLQVPNSSSTLWSAQNAQSLEA